MISKEKRLKKAEENVICWERCVQEAEDELIGARVVKAPRADALSNNLPRYRENLAVWGATVKEMKKGKKR